jgi:hypothetical protein
MGGGGVVVVVVVVVAAAAADDDDDSTLVLHLYVYFLFLCRFHKDGVPHQIARGLSV